MSGIAGEDLPEFWRGCITGTNRASVLARLRREGATVRARVLLDDTVNGPAVCTLIGTLDGTHADLRLLSFAPSAPQFPVAVSLTLDFRDNNQRATGSWASDVATAGVCELVAAHVPESVWWWKRGTTYAGLLVQSPSYYATTLLVVAALSLLRLLHLTYPVLVLILIPALFVFRQHIRALIDYFGLTKADSGPRRDAGRGPSRPPWGHQSPWG